MAKELVTLSKDLLLLQSSIEEQVTLTEDVLLLSIDKRSSHSITVLLIITRLNSSARTVMYRYCRLTTFNVQRNGLRVASCELN
jgi:hypothetical protein